MDTTCSANGQTATLNYEISTMWETKPGTTRPTISWLVMDQKRSRDLKLMIMMIIY